MVYKNKQYTRTKPKKIFTDYLDKHKITHYYQCCCVCGWNESTIDFAHLTPHRENGGYTVENIIPLCPNHHRVLDRDIMSDIQTHAIQAFLWRVCKELGLL